MSKPRTTERKLRQRRKAKLAKLHQKFLHAKTQDSKARIAEKAEAVSPTTSKEKFAEIFAK